MEYLDYQNTLVKNISMLDTVKQELTAHSPSIAPLDSLTFFHTNHLLGFEGISKRESLTDVFDIRRQVQSVRERMSPSRDSDYRSPGDRRDAISRYLPEGNDPSNGRSCERWTFPPVFIFLLPRGGVLSNLGIHGQIWRYHIQNL